MLEPDGYSSLKKCCRDSLSALFTGICIQNFRPVYIRYIYPNKVSPSSHEQIIQNYRQLKTVSLEYVTKLLDLRHETSPGYAFQNSNRMFRNDRGNRFGR